MCFSVGASAAEDGDENEEQACVGAGEHVVVEVVDRAAGRVIIGPMTKHASFLLAALAATALPLAVLPTAHADICGPDVNANGCLPPGAVQEGAGILGSIAVADAADDWRQRMEGRPPCRTPEGVPYYTPGDSPCL